jgi:signal transduction histidine kinase
MTSAAHGMWRRNEQASAPAGHGLSAMRERAALHGGQLRTGHQPGGGFTVKATFPLNGDAS